MNVRLLAGLTLALLACPERQAPARGLQLVYRKPTADSVRSVVDRRLAQLKLQANLHEDDSMLTVRVAEGADLSRIKALLAITGRLEFCAEDTPVAARWCDSAWPEGVSINRERTTSCSLLAATRKDLDLALADAGVDLAFGTSGTQASAWVIDHCLSPRIVSAEVSEEPRGLTLSFDGAGTRDFAALTKDLLHRLLIIRLDGVVTSVPIVLGSVTSGRAVLTTGAQARGELELLGASLVGGPLPLLVLEREGTWGPPSLKLP